jgi:HPt (histidine-containing phosphotransfer) domain-containing protein
VKIIDPNLVLDRNQLREVTVDDQDLMRDILAALIEDTSRQILLLDVAITAGDATQCVRLAHYAKGACANVGANSSAVLLEKIERQASSGSVANCEEQVTRLSAELERLRTEIALMTT